MPISIEALEKAVTEGRMIKRGNLYEADPPKTPEEEERWSLRWEEFRIEYNRKFRAEKERRRIEAFEADKAHADFRVY